MDPVVVDPTPPVIPPSFKWQSLLPVVALVLILPAIVAGVKIRQLIAPKATSGGTVATVRINPGQIITLPRASPIPMSALAFDAADQPIDSGLTYTWGMSSTNSIGTIKIDATNTKLAIFYPDPNNIGQGDIFVQAFGSAGTASGSIPVFVGITPPTPFPTPVATPGPTPTPTPLTQLPDLVSPGIPTPSGVPMVNQPVRITFQMTNIGGSPANPAEYAYTSQADGSSTLLATNTCTANTVLNYGQSCVSDYSFIFPTAGQKTLNVKLDPNNRVVEANENNNVYSVTFNVLPGPTPTPRPKPTPTTTIFPSAVPTPKPSAFPTPTPTTNFPPVFLTSDLPNGSIWTTYLTTISGYDQNPGDILTMHLVQAPLGSKLTGCTQSVTGYKQISCSYKWFPYWNGTYSVTVAILDNQGSSVTRTYSLLIL